MERAMKGGLGTYCLQVGELLIGAVVAVNCLGDVVDPGDGKIIAGAIQTDPFHFLDCEAGMVRQFSDPGNRFAGNTTIGAVITNAKLTKAQATKVASMAHDGYARTMRPAHTLLDGDTIFTLSVGGVDADIFSCRSNGGEGDGAGGTGRGQRSDDAGGIQKLQGY